MQPRTSASLAPAPAPSVSARPQGRVGAPELQREGLAMVFDVILGRLVAMADGLLRMAMRDEGLMRGMGVVLLRVVSRGFAMMPRCLLVMACRSFVVLGSAEYLAHEVLQFRRVWMRAGRQRRWSAGRSRGCRRKIRGERPRAPAA